MTDSPEQPPLVLIPARGGSKRVPRKNVRPFLGVPAIQRTIELVLTAGFATPVVSTDDEEVARLAEAAGATVPFVRPPALATDHASTIDVVRHAIEAVRFSDDDANAVVVVYPTALLLRPERLAQAWDAFLGSQQDFLVPVIRAAQPIERALRVRPDGMLDAVAPEALAVRTQDLPAAFFDAGQFYMGRRAAWLSGGPLDSASALSFELDRAEVVDIDTEEDWRLAERLAGVHLQEHGVRGRRSLD